MYPENPEHRGPWDGADEETPLGKMAAKADWDILNTDFWDIMNTNRALVNRFLAYLNVATIQASQVFYQQNQNMVFGRVFQWFLERYGQSNETDRFENQTRMEADWSFDNRVETLINQINTGLRYAVYTRNPMSDGKTVDTAMQIVLKKDLFREAYATWHQR